MTYQEARAIAENHKYAPVLAAGATEYVDRYVFSCTDENGNMPDVPSMFVKKADGKVGTFFLPDYSPDFLRTGKEID